jgi:hypothetical protein
VVRAVLGIIFTALIRRESDHLMHLDDIPANSPDLVMRAFRDMQGYLCNDLLYISGMGCTRDSIPWDGFPGVSSPYKEGRYPEMGDTSAIGLLLGLLLELLGIGSAVKLRIGRAAVTISLGGFLIAASLGLIVIL